MFHLLLIIKHLKDGTLTTEDILLGIIFGLLNIVPIAYYYRSNIPGTFILYILKDPALFPSAIIWLTGALPLLCIYLTAFIAGTIASNRIHKDDQKQRP